MGMARLTIKDFSDFEQRIAKLEGSVVGVCKMGVYDGAAKVADALADAVGGLGTDIAAGGVTDAQRAGLIEGLGVAKMRDDGGRVTTSVSFSGYNSQATSGYPKGQPNVMIARSLEGGSSVNRPTRFASRAVRRARAGAEAAMKETVERRIAQLAE